MPEPLSAEARRASRPMTFKGEHVSGKELIEAVRLKNASRIKELLDRGADPNAVYGPHELGLSQSFFGDEIPVFIAACMTGNTEIIKLFISGGADVNSITRHEKYYMMSDDGYMADGGHALCFLCISGLTEAAELLIGNGAKIDMNDADRRTPLMRASQYGHLETVKMLVEKGADMTRKDGDFNTALTLACDNGYFRVAEYLKEMKAPGKFAINWTYALFNSVLRHDPDGVKKAVEEHGISVDSNKWFRKYTPLMMACETGDLEIADYLLNMGADINAECEEKNWTPLLFAVKSGSVDMVKKICETGCEITDKIIKKALKSAREKGYKDVEEYLVTVNRCISR